jgi:hypothetical protein
MASMMEQLPPVFDIPDPPMQQRQRVLSDVPTLYDEYVPRIIVEKSPDMLRTHSAPLPGEDTEVIVPEETNQQATARMTWIMQMAMDTILPTLRPEQRKLVEGTTDLRGLIVPLFRKWEEFRAGEGRAGRTRKVARSVYEKVKSNFTNNEVFEHFWRRKVGAERDEESYAKFEGVVRGVMEQVNFIDRALGGVNNVRTSSKTN